MVSWGRAFTGALVYLGYSLIWLVIGGVMAGGGIVLMAGAERVEWVGWFGVERTTDWGMLVGGFFLFIVGLLVLEVGTTASYFKVHSEITVEETGGRALGVPFSSAFKAALTLLAYSIFWVIVGGLMMAGGIFAGRVEGIVLIIIGALIAAIGSIAAALKVHPEFLATWISRSSATGPPEKHCRECGAEMPAEAIYCPECGTDQRRKRGQKILKKSVQRSAFCWNCGEKLPIGANVCPACGVSQRR